MDINYSKEYEAIVEAYKKAGGNPEGLLNSEYASMVINNHDVLAKNEVPGLHIDYSKIKDGVKVIINVDEGVRVKNPVHLCFGMLPREGRQVIDSDFHIGKNAKISFLAHCSFPDAEHIEHIMKSQVTLDDGAEMAYVEQHYHSESGGTFVYPKLSAKIGKGARLVEEFKLKNGRVGLLDIDYEVDQGPSSSCELLTKVFGKKNDKIDVKESIHLNGEYASGTAKSRLVMIDQASGNVLGEVEGNAAHSRGHIDCYEVVQDEGSIATSTPKISVTNPLSKVTHEAAIGRINKKELETLMARGLNEENAVELIVNGLLR